MSANDIPYQLRPNKFIDRQVFLDLLSRVLAETGVERYSYISMGGRHMADHCAVYRRLGISNLLSFDREQRIVDRQHFNRPIEQTVCTEMDSSSLPDQMDAFRSKFSPAESLILWLDYTEAKSRLGQLQEFVEVLKAASADDIIRITMNCEIRTVAAPSDWKKQKFASPGAARSDKLRSQLGEFFPSDFNSIEEDTFPNALAQSIKLAASSAQVERDDLDYELLLLTTYADGHRMFTATIRVVEQPVARNFSKSVRTWKLRSRYWSDILRIDAPDLSQREKHKIDQYLKQSPKKILQRLKFLPDENEQQSIEAIKSYKRLHRYYPAFHHVET